jgi:hypothetical protein
VSGNKIYYNIKKDNKQSIPLSYNLSREAFSLSTDLTNEPAT